MFVAHSGSVRSVKKHYQVPKYLLIYIFSIFQMLLYLYSDTNYALAGFVAEYFITKSPITCPNYYERCTGEKKCNCTEENNAIDKTVTTTGGVSSNLTISNSNNTNS